MESKSRRLQARNLFDPVAVVRDSRVHGVSNLLTKALSERRSKKKESGSSPPERLPGSQQDTV